MSLEKAEIESQNGLLGDTVSTEMQEEDAR